MKEIIKMLASEIENQLSVVTELSARKASIKESRRCCKSQAEYDTLCDEYDDVNEECNREVAKLQHMRGALVRLLEADGMDIFSIDSWEPEKTCMAKYE